MSRINKIIIAQICLITPLLARVQIPDFIVLEGKDTVLCISVEVKRSAGIVSRMDCTPVSGRFFTISGINDCEKVTSFRVDNQIFDLIPVKPARSEKIRRHVWRKIDGSIRVYDDFNWARGQQEGKYTPVSEGLFLTTYLVQLDDIYTEINETEMEDKIKPFMLRCERFAQAKRHEYSTERDLFEDLVKLYNYLCIEPE